MPKIYEYFGFIFFFYSNEHEPIHVHATANGRESVLEIIMDNGEIACIHIRKADNKPPLKSNEQKIAEEFVRKYALNIISKWVKFFVLKKKVKNTIIRRKL